MLHEWEGIRQREEEGHRRWYVDEAMDLIVWFEDSDVVGFQLCYDKGSDEKAVTWHRDGGVTHTHVDAGEDRPGSFKSSPVLTSSLPLETERVCEAFRSRAEDIDPATRRLVLDTLSDVK